MELRQLKYFVKVAETLNFSEAAKALCVTQSTLSQQVKQLEQEMGAQLLARTSHSVSMTEAGQELLPYARETLRNAEQCVERIHDLNSLATGTLNIGVTYSFSPILTETLITFMKLYPRIKLNIYYKPMAELMEMLSEREIDFLLAFRPSHPVEGVESHILFQNNLAVIVGTHHPLASRTSVTIDDLKRFDLALPARGLQARNAFRVFSCVSYDFLDNLIRESQRISRIHLSVFDKGLGDGVEWRSLCDLCSLFGLGGLHGLGCLRGLCP